MNHRSLLACLLGLFVGLLMSDALAQTRPPADAALGALIEELTDRRSDDLFSEDLPDGSKVIDLKGRFQQVPLAQFIGEGQAMVACVNSVEEANTFFGRDLLSGSPLPRAASDAHAALVTEALRHGMSVAEYQFYGDLIEQGLAAPGASGSTVTIVNNDSPGEGFNSTAEQFLPAPGNDANANLGEQRLALFNAAAQIWGDFLDSGVAIQIRSQFDPLPCSMGSAVLGSAGALGLVSDFTNAEFSSTYYHIALANKRAGIDHSGNPDVDAIFNSDIDTECFGAGWHFYYGLDNATPSNTINLFVVLLHEMGHGLGSSSFTGQTGAYLGEIPDIWARFLLDSTAGLTWFQMNDAQRAASAINTNNLFWDGANVRNASGGLSAGRDAPTGRVQMYAPNPYRGGSSVSHYSNAAFPNLLMEPSINSGLPLDLDLTRQQMRDIGWYRDTSSDLVPDTITSVFPSGGSLQVDSSHNITWTNTGGFDRNVTIELSLDGGSTYPIVVASNVVNSGSRAWTVPDNPTTQGRLRVREHDFLSPLGQSAADFVIGSGNNTAPAFTPASAIVREQGSDSGPADTVGTASDAETAAGSLILTHIGGGTASGISVGSISNTAGTVTATLAASCSATAGTVRFQASDGSLNGTGDLQLNVSANSAPELSYGNRSVDSGDATSVNPATGPLDNGSVISIAVQDTDTYSGTISVDAAGVVSISNAQPVGTHTITVRATDNCGAITGATFDLQVDNTAPTFTPAAAIIREQGSAAGAAVTVGTVNDAETEVGSLIVTQIAGGTASGISVDGIANTDGTVMATLAASCSATTGTVRFQVSDGDLNSGGDLQLNVTLNTPPTLGSYADSTVPLGQGTLVSPDAAPMDNGSVDSIDTAILPPTFAGTLNAELGTGEVSIGVASPSDSYTVSVTITDNCSATAEQDFVLEVLVDDVFADGFETP